MQMIIVIFISLAISLFPFFRVLRKEKFNKKIIYNKYLILASFVILIGCLSRLLFISNVPFGLNKDEASIGYEAYAILKYGICRNGMKMPVHLIAWGSGQNALYAYMIIPFIYFLKVSAFSVRLPMALLGCISLIFIYYFSKECFGEKKGLIFLTLFILLPWHMMKSRWGLESNVFPDLIMMSTILIYFFVKKKKFSYLHFSSVILGISTYAYGTSYFFVPIYFLFVYFGLFKKKKINFRQILREFLIVFSISLPMILFVIINYFNLPQITFGNMTIPRLHYNRFVQLTGVSGNFCSKAINNFKALIILLLTGDDGLVLNRTKIFGLFYPFSIIFIILGIIWAFKNMKKGNNLFLINSLFIASFLLSLMVPPNINRVNVLWIPLIFYLIYAVILIYETKPKITYFVLIIYLIFFILFINYYFVFYNKNEIGDQTAYGLDEAISSIENEKYNNLYIDNNYIYYLYYTKMNPHYYLNNRVMTEKNVMFERISNIGNVYFYIPNKLDKGNVYIISNRHINKYKKLNYKKYGYYNVVY